MHLNNSQETVLCKIRQGGDVPIVHHDTKKHVDITYNNILIIMQTHTRQANIKKIIKYYAA